MSKPMTKEKAYKELRDKLGKKFNNPYVSFYEVIGGVYAWVNQHNIKCTTTHLSVLTQIFGSIPYAYQKADRKRIIKYLKNNKNIMSIHE